MSEQTSETHTPEGSADPTHPTHPAHLTDPTEGSESSGPIESPTEVPAEVPEADLLEQAQDAAAQPSWRKKPVSSAIEEASEADLLDQMNEVPLDDDSYR